MKKKTIITCVVVLLVVCIAESLFAFWEARKIRDASSQK